LERSDFGSRAERVIWKKLPLAGELKE